MTFVACDHEASVTVSIGDLDVGAVFHQKFHYFKVTVEASGSQRRAVRFGGAVHIGAFTN